MLANRMIMGAAGVEVWSDPPSWDLLDEPCNDFSSVITWADGDNGNAVSEISPAGQFRMDCNAANAADNDAKRSGDFGDSADLMTTEIKLYHDALGTLANVDRAVFYIGMPGAATDLIVYFASDGCFIRDANPDNIEIGTNLVKVGEWQTWRFVTNSTASTVNVYLTDSTHTQKKVGTNIAFDWVALASGDITIQQTGRTTNDMLMHVDYIKVATGAYPS